MTDQQIRQILKRLDDQDLEYRKRLDKQDEALQEIHETIAPIAETYRNANAIKRFVYAAIIALGTIAGSIIAVRELIKWK